MLQLARQPTTKTRRTQAEPLAIKSLLSYRIHVVANLLSRSAALRYKREFDVSLWEWRTIALLGAQAPLSLAELAKEAGLDKGQMSRVVAGLAKRALITRGIDEHDARGVRLALTKAGGRVYEGLMRAAAERNEAFLGCLTRDERASLDRVLAKLGAQARAMIDRERLSARR